MCYEKDGKKDFVGSFTTQREVLRTNDKGIPESFYTHFYVMTLVGKDGEVIQGKHYEIYKEIKKQKTL
jgi:hypothetical protein